MSYTDYNTVYRISYTNHGLPSRASESVQIDIKRRGYSGSITNLTAGSTPLMYGMDTSDEYNKYVPVRASYCDVSFIVTDENDIEDYREFFTYDGREWMCDIEKDGATWWRGYLLPDLYNEPHKGVPFEMKLSFVDGIKILETKKILTQDTTQHETINPISLWDIFIKIYTYLYDLDLGVKFACNIFGIWQETDFIYNSWAEQYTCGTALQKSGNPDSNDLINLLDCRTVLEDLCKAFGMTFFQREGYWYLVRVDQLFNDFDYIYTTPFQTILPGGFGTVGKENILKQLGSARSGTPLYGINESINISLRPAWNRATFVFEPNEQSDEEVLFNQSLELNNSYWIQDISSASFCTVTIAGEGDNYIRAKLTQDKLDTNTTKEVIYYNDDHWLRNDIASGSDLSILELEFEARGDISSAGYVYFQIAGTAFSSTDFKQSIDKGQLITGADVEPTKWTKFSVRMDTNTLGLTRQIARVQLHQFRGYQNDYIDIRNIKIRDVKNILSKYKNSSKIHEIEINSDSFYTPNEIKSRFFSYYQANQTFSGDIYDPIDTFASVFSPQAGIIYRGGFIGRLFPTALKGNLLYTSLLTYNIRQSDGNLLYDEYRNTGVSDPTGESGGDVYITGKDLKDIILEQYKQNYSQSNWKISGTMQGNFVPGDLIVFMENRRFLPMRVQYDDYRGEVSFEYLELKAPIFILPGEETSYNNDYSNDYTI